MLNKALRLLRVFNDYKSNFLAERLEISTSYLSEIESGKKVPSLELLQKYAKVFEIPLSTILLMSEGFEKEPDNFKAQLSKVLMKFLEKVEEQGDPEKV